MKPLSKESEEKILDAIQDVCAYVNSGLAPTEATIKVAEEQSLSPNFIRLVCTGYNTGATTYQREKSAKILDKLAEFPLADVNEVLAKIYPPEPKPNSILKQSNIVSDEYSRAPKVARVQRLHSEKVASLKLPSKKADKPDTTSQQEKLAKAYRAAVAIRDKANTKRAEYSKAQDDLLYTLGQLSDSVRAEIHNNSFNFANLKSAAVLKYGAAGKAVVNYVEQKLGKLIKTKSAGLVTANWDSGPGLLVSKAIKQAQAVNALAQDFVDEEDDKLDEMSNLLQPFSDVLSPEDVNKKASILVNTQTKQANGFLGGLLGSSIAKSLGTGAANSTGLSSTGQQMSSRMVDELDDPDHDNELRRIQTQSMMNDLMMNDEVISGYDPGEVMSAYNEIVNLTPRSATQPAIIRPLLRKRLSQGAIEPFEASEMVNIEKNLGQARANQPHLDGQSAQTKQGQANVLQHKILG